MSPFARGLNVLLLAVFTLTLVAWLRKDVLPPTSSMLPVLQQDPVQTPTDEKTFDFKYAGAYYRIKPVAEYELWGLVVSHNNIASPFDIYHTNDAVDFRDICVIWGQNVLTGDHRDIDFWSEPWTCNFKTDSWDVYNRFRLDQISNTHMLSDSPRVRERARAAEVGDQVTFRGLLVDYCPELEPEALRRTSTTREDTGNGACEVMLVREFKVLRRGNPFWQGAFDVSKWCLLGLVLARAALFVRSLHP